MSGLVTTWLLAIASHTNPGTDRANSRLDAVRTGLTAGAGAGAAVGLMLAFRRPSSTSSAPTCARPSPPPRRQPANRNRKPPKDLGECGTRPEATTDGNGDTWRQEAGACYRAALMDFDMGRLYGGVRATTEAPVSISHTVRRPVWA